MHMCTVWCIAVRPHLFCSRLKSFFNRNFDWCKFSSGKGPKEFSPDLDPALSLKVNKLIIRRYTWISIIYKLVFLFEEKRWEKLIKSGDIPCSVWWGSGSDEKKCWIRQWKITESGSSPGMRIRFWPKKTGSGALYLKRREIFESLLSNFFLLI